MKRWPVNHRVEPVRNRVLREIMAETCGCEARVVVIGDVIKPDPELWRRAFRGLWPAACAFFPSLGPKPSKVARVGLRGVARLVFLAGTGSAAPRQEHSRARWRWRNSATAWLAGSILFGKTSLAWAAPAPPPVSSQSAAPSSASVAKPIANATATASGKASGKPPLLAYLRRPHRPSARYLDHGVLEFFVAPGIPQIYRLGVAVGVLDHLTLGVAGHWLPGQKIPVFVPHAALRILQYSLFEFGLSYRGGLFQVPKIPEPGDPDAMIEGPADQLTPLFEKRAHFLLAGLGFVHQYVSAGAELGFVNRRILLRNVPKPNAYRFETVWDGASAVYVRLGNRCAGVTMQAFYPSLDVELRLDLRWSAFAVRERSCR